MALSCYTLICFISICTLFFVFAAAASKKEEETLHLSSLFPSSVCSPSTLGTKRRGSLEVVHKHGPCSMLNGDMATPLTLEELLTHDQSRVDSIIKARLAMINKTTGNQDSLDSKITTLPAKSGSTIGSASYIVTVGLGTPEKKLSLIFDTGSDLTWTQCQPCAGTCYDQQEPIFAPSGSNTYTNISCTTNECSELASATGITPVCYDSTRVCAYSIRYGDNSSSEGFFGKEKLTLTPNDVVDDFYFGCGQDNEGLFDGAAGLMGLGRNKLSIVSQTAMKYAQVFSYCLPSVSSSTGHLTFGGSGLASNVKYTPLAKTQGGTFYDLTLTSITVGATKLPISPSVFQMSGMIIDSGTVITRLPPIAYSALRDEFREQMKKYPLTTSVPFFDTCYDLSNYTTNTITIPKISFLWGEDTNVEIAPQGRLYGDEMNQMCLAFAPNVDDSSIGIFGNVQQKTLEVVYDVVGGKVGFAPRGCA